jgi:hypothetical protein
MKKTIPFCVFLAMGIVVFAQDHKQQEQPSASDLSATTQSMSEGHHHEMGPHMQMTMLRAPQPGDQEKADKIVEQARQSLSKYKDYKVALADGYKIFLPNVPQKMYHFTNWQYGADAAFGFDATRPTSLLYKKTGDGYELIGVMYTAPQRFTESQINDRVPLSVAQWHQHVNMCRPPQGKQMDVISRDPRFGLGGSISTREPCDAAGGTFVPHVFGWMVHMYPWEKTPDAIWSVERQRESKAGEDHAHHHDDGVSR